MRRALPALLALAAAGCAAPAIPVLPAAQGPALAAKLFVATDGALLPAREWLPAGEPGAVVLALHGFNDYANAFETLGAFLAPRGVAVYAYDQRGFGGAPGRNYWPGSEALVADAAAAARLLRQRHRGVPLYCFGESMGGAVLMAGAGRGALPCDALILSAPAVWGRQVMPGFQRAALDLASAVAPDYVVTGAGLNVRASDNIAALRALGRDPMVIKGARLDAIAGVADLMTEAFDAAARLHGPLLWLCGDKDQIVPPRAVAPAQDRLPADGAHRLARYANGYHLLTRDLSAAVVLHDVAAWIADPSAPLPSGADRAGKVFWREKERDMNEQRRTAAEKKREESLAGMGGGIAGPAEPGAAGTAGGGTAVGGETSDAKAPGRERARRG